MDKRCEDCVLHHPERPQRPCSCFGECCNDDGACAAYIGSRQSGEAKQD